MKSYSKENRLRRRKAKRIARTVSGVLGGLSFLMALGTAGAVDTGATLTFGTFIKALGFMALMVVCVWYAGGFDYLIKEEN